MPIELPSCHGEYHWSQRLPLPVALSAVLHLPHYCRLFVSAGEEDRRQTLAIALAQSTTGLGHLIINELTHDGCATEPAVTDGLLHLALNTMILLLKTHCPARLSVGGSTPVAVLSGIDVLAIPWDHWGFQVSSVRPRILARVRELKLALPASTCGIPASLPLQALQWEAL
jgi:hypothetical protein